MLRSSIRLCALLVPALLWPLLTGCSTHDKAWDTDADTTPSQTTPSPANPAPAPAGEVIVSVGAGGTITCKVNGASINPLNGDDILRNEGGAPGSRLLIVQDNGHGREACFAVAVDLNSPDISSEGRTTVRHLRHNLVIEADGPSIVTLFTQDVQDDIDDSVAFAGNNDLFRLADRLNADPALVDGRDSKRGKTALARAAENGRTEVVDFLLARKASTEVKDDQGFAPLHLAVIHGRLDIVKRLVQHGADVNAVTAAGNTPMHLALKNGHTEIAAYLAGAGADSNRPNLAGKTPMQIALDKVFELGERRDYGPFADGSSIRYEDSKLYVRRSDKTDQNNQDQFDLPASKEKWISLQGTHFMVMVRDHGTNRVWARYHPEDSTTTK